MDLYDKSLLFVILIILILVLVGNCLNKNQENFQETVFNTIITKLDPFEGDSSTIVTIKGVGLNNIGKILFNGVECAILENRSDSEIQIIPPSLSELGLNISDVRKVMKEKNEGLKVKISIARRDINTKKILGNSSDDIDNVVVVPGVHFFYIDRIPYENNCPKPPEQVPPPEESEIVDIPQQVPKVEYLPNSDLEFIQKVLPAKEAKLDILIGELNNTLEKNKEINTNDITYLKIIQALDSLNKYKQEMNIQRFNIHNTLKERYGYPF